MVYNILSYLIELIYVVAIINGIQQAHESTKTQNKMKLSADKLTKI